MTRQRGRDASRTNLPSLASSFHGRSDELKILDTAFEISRLVSIVGPGGMGKTRLALQHAAQRLPVLARRGRGGVWFVDVSQARRAGAAASAVAGALRLPWSAERTRSGGDERAQLDRVGRAIAALGPALIVLDNLEQLGPLAAPLVEGWLQMAPSARWLVTTRLVLGLAGEQVLTLGPLGPEDARALFVDRAGAVRAGRTLALGDGLVAQIVASIDRMPLAIELAASRTRVLSGEALRDRLVRPLDVLAADETTRHGSLRRTVLDSVAPLPPITARAFALLATLRNGFSLDAAEAVLSPLRLGSVEVLDAIEALVRSSLLRVETEGRHARYAYFETIREVAEEQRACDPESEAAQRALVRHYAAVSVHALSAPAGDALAGLDHEGTLSNLLAAGAVACALGDGASALSIALALDPHLSRRGLAAQREHLLSDALAASAGSDAVLDEASIIEAHLARGAARREMGDGHAAQQDFEVAHRRATELGEPGLRASAAMRLGGIRDLRGDTAGARELLAHALDLLAQTTNGPLRRAREAEALLRLGHAHRREGALEAAREAITSAVTRRRAQRDDEGLASALYELGVVEMFRGERDAAFACFDEGLEIARRSGARVMEGACLTARGCMLQELGQLEAALTHHADAASIFRDHGSALRHASALHYLATTYLERGEPGEALGPLLQARQLMEGVGSPRYDVLTRGAWAVALAALARHDEAAEVIGPATAALDEVPHEPSLAVALALHRATLATRAGRSEDALSLAEAALRVDAAPSDDTRFALRELTRARARDTGGEAHPALLVWGEGQAFQAPGGARVTLPARSPLRRLLALLVARREQAPGEPVSLDQLIEAGWPGEKMGADAALNRAYVGIATLRKRGLREPIVRIGGGYAISQAVTVRRFDGGPSAT